SNAVKFTGKGEVLVCVSRVQEDAQQVIVRIEVRDTGIGIPPEAMSRIFQEFTQADGSTTRKYGGTGLGLTISKQIVSLMQGRMGVESKPGRGSTFWFQVPFEKQTAPAAPARPEKLEALAGVRVLIIDDSPTQRSILDQQLRQWGMLVDAVAGAEEALSRMR